jgi:hypothetical protein
MSWTAEVFAEKIHDSARSVLGHAHNADSVKFFYSGPSEVPHASNAGPPNHDQTEGCAMSQHQP